MNVCADSKFILLVGREYTIGRRDADIVAPNDMSISRKHAVIRVVHPESNIVSLRKLRCLLSCLVCQSQSTYLLKKICFVDIDVFISSQIL